MTETVQPDAKVEVHHDHRDVAGGWLRPSVFGAMDGLISNLSLIAGVAGGVAASRTTGHIVVLTGLAGLFAGAFSMAVGEYTSVASQTELVEAEIAIEKREIARRPEAEEAELAALYRKRGLSMPLAREVAKQLSANHEIAWRVHAREELGVDPDDLPSPYVAAFSSFGSFAVGALVPLLPYLLGAHVLWISLVLSAVALFVTGAAVGRLTSRRVTLAGLRPLLLGAAAAGVTYAIGSAVGVGLS